MKIDAYNCGRDLTLKISGEIDHHGAKDAIGDITMKIEIFKPEICRLDMENVTFMDSSGIAVVLCAYNSMRELDGRMQLRNVPKQPQKVLNAAGVDKLINSAV